MQATLRRIEDKLQDNATKQDIEDLKDTVESLKQDLAEKNDENQ